MFAGKLYSQGRLAASNVVGTALCSHDMLAGVLVLLEGEADPGKDYTLVLDSGEAFDICVAHDGDDLVFVSELALRRAAHAALSNDKHQESHLEPNFINPPRRY